MEKESIVILITVLIFIWAMVWWVNAKFADLKSDLAEIKEKLKS